MQSFFDFLIRHWQPIALFGGSILAVWFVVKHKNRLFYNKP